VTISPVVSVLLPATGIIWAVCEVRQALQRRAEATRVDRGSHIAIRFAILVGVLGAVLAKKSAPSAMIGPPGLAAWIGLVVLWCGVGLRLWAFQTLGRYFTFTVQTSDDQPVISAGPYRVIRHPGYAGILIAVIGIGFVIDNWGSLVVLSVALACGLIYRITVEERALSQDLGGRYQAYAKNHKRLIPFIW